MGVYRASHQATGPGTNLLPVSSLYAPASVRGLLLGIEAFNVSGSASELQPVRLTSTGTQGSSVTAYRTTDPDMPAPTLTAWDTHTAGPTITDRVGERVRLAAAVGSGYVWNFRDKPIRIPAGTANGIGLFVPAGTGQAVDVTWIWEE